MSLAGQWSAKEIFDNWQDMYIKLLVVKLKRASSSVHGNAGAD